MKKIALLIVFLCAGMACMSQPEHIYIGGQVTDVETGGPVGDHLVFAALNDSLGYFTFVTDMDGYYGDTIYINAAGVSYVHVYTFDCLFMMHDSLLTDLSVPLNVNFTICTTIMPPECWASFFYYPDSLDFLTWNFIDQSVVSNGTVPDSWFWDFGDGSFSAEQNPTHTYAGEGIYMVCLTIYDDELNCENTFCLELMILGGPSDCENEFTYLTNDGYTFTFTGRVNSLNPASYSWDFGDGTSGEGQEVTHTFPMEPPLNKMFNVCLTTFTVDSINDSCYDVSCQQIFTGNPMECQAWFYYYPADTSNEEPTFQFIDNSIGIHDSWLWDFGDGGSSSEQNPLHTYSETGYYIVCLTIWDSNGACQSIYCEEVYVGVTPPWDCFNFFNYYLNDSLTVTFSGEAFWGGFPMVADSYTWDFGDGTTGEGQTVIHTYPNDSLDFYMVCLTAVLIDPATGETCESTSCMEVWLKNIPPPIGCDNYFTYELTDLNTYTFYGEAMYGGMIVQADSYLWDFGDGTSGEGLMITHTFGINPSQYLVCLTTYITDPVLNDSCFATSCQEIGNNGGDVFTVFGQVIMGNSMADMAQVSLYMLKPDGEMVIMGMQPVDSAGHYAFYQVGPGNYYLLAELLPGSSQFGNYLPTYYENAITWTEADMISLEEPFNPYNIYMVSVNAYTPGSGAITGTINLNYGLFRNGEPASDVEIILMNHNDQAILYMYSTDLGTFDFNALGWGTYKVHAEVPGKLTSHAMVTLDEEHTAGIVEFTITATEVYGSLSIHELTPVLLTVGAVYPNPAADVAMLPVTLSRTTILSFRITDQLGRSISGFTRGFAAGHHLIEIPTAELPAGVYILEIEADDSEMTVQKIIK